MKMYAKMNEQQNRNSIKPDTTLKPATKPTFTVHMKNGQLSYSNDDIQFDNLMDQLVKDGELDEDVYQQCLQMIATGVVDLDRICEYGKYYGDTLLSAMIRLKQMDKVVELLQLGANAFIQLTVTFGRPVTPASLFWKTMTNDKENPSQYYEAFKLIRKQAELREQMEESGASANPRKNDVYMCVEDNTEQADPNVLVYEDLLGRQDCSELYCTDEANLFE